MKALGTPLCRLATEARPVAICLHPSQTSFEIEALELFASGYESLTQTIRRRGLEKKSERGNA
jgi:hypothetical protein